MLKLAYTYKDELQKVYQSIVFDNKYKYYNNGLWWNYDINISDNSWNNLQLVSVNENNEVIGYFDAEINRNCEKVDSLGVINFKDKGNIIFSKDLYKFLIDLFLKFNFRKIEFSVVIGNPIEKMYDKYINKYGGRIIGVIKENTKFQDNKYYDLKLYEIFRKDFMRYHK